MLPSPGERVGCPLMLRQLSVMLMSVPSGPVCPQWGLILTPSSPLSWPSVSHETAGKGSSEGQEDGGPHTHPETWAFLLGEGPPSFSIFFKALKDNSISAFSFVFKITNISAFVYVRIRNWEVLWPVPLSQDENQGSNSKTRGLNCSSLLSPNLAMNGGKVSNFMRT